VTVASYLARIRDHLNDAGGDPGYPRSVFATFQAAIAEAESRTPGSAALACLSAFLAADGIPETLFHVARETDAVLEDHLVPMDAACDLAAALHTTGNVEDALGALDRFSLITFYVRTRTFDMHPLVQAAARDMVRGENGGWDRSAILTLNAAFPRPMVLARPAFETWDICARILPHARSALALLPPDSVFHEAGSLAAKCGAYLVDRAEYTEAERLLRWSIDVAEHEPDMPAAASRWSALGLALRRMKRYAEAEELYRKALLVARSPNGLKPNEVSAILANLGVLLTDIGRSDEAEALLREATSIDITERSDDVELAVDFDELGEVLADQGELDEAQAIAERALPLKERKLSQDDPRVAMTMRNIGSILAKRGLYSRAIRILRKALATLEAVYDADHPDIVQTRHDLALALKHTAAERLTR
jgi:tetratricopeptide (TPR) repeat protein